MSFSKGLRIERSQRGIVNAVHSCGLSVRRTVDGRWLNNPKISDAAFERELDRIEKAAIEALKNLYAHKYKPKGRRK